MPWFYAWKALWPANLMFVYPHWKIDSGEASQYVFPIALVALAIILGLLARKNRGPLAAFLFFVGTLFPALGFLNVYPFRYSYVADHFQYLALPGIIVPVCAGLTLLARRTRTGSNPIIALAAAALLATTLGAATYRQSANYRDYETLFRNALAHNPESSFLHSNLGVILMSSGRETEAAAEFQAAVRLTPDDPDYRVNHGLALAQTQDGLAGAVAEYQHGLADRPPPCDGAPQPRTCLFLDAGPHAGCHRGVPKGDRRIPRRPAGRSRRCGRRISIWGSPMARCPAAKRTQLPRNASLSE